jgi:hypothetical protein
LSAEANAQKTIVSMPALLALSHSAP